MLTFWRSTAAVCAGAATLLLAGCHHDTGSAAPGSGSQGTAVVTPSGNIAGGVPTREQADQAARIRAAQMRAQQRPPGQ